MTLLKLGEELLETSQGNVIKLIDEEGNEASEGEVVYSGRQPMAGITKTSITLKAWGS